MSFWGDFFSWFRGKEETTNPTKQTQRRPQDIDKTESLSVNRALTAGLYHNSYPGLKLAGALAFTPIAVPLWFMGCPTPATDDDATNEILKELVEQFYPVMKQINLQCHRDGTIWVFPKFSAKKNTLIWELIQDDTVVDIVKDLETGEPVMIITDEEILLTIGENKTAIVQRKRFYTKDRIEVKWFQGKGSIPEALLDQSMRNVAGVLPIPFSNNADSDTIRGHSDYGRIISDLKDYHDIDLKQSGVLAKFEPKLALKVKNVDDWLINNGEQKGSLGTLDVKMRDILFLVGDEAAEYIFPTNFYEAVEAALKRKYRKVVEGSGVPEILWGTKLEGNSASAAEQMANVVKFIEDKRDQKNTAYAALFSASLVLLNIARFESNQTQVKIEWNTLDALSDEIKAKIFNSFTQGLSFLISTAGATKAMILEIWNRFFPGIAPEKKEDFIKGLSDMAKFKQFLSAEYATVADMTGDQEEDAMLQLMDDVANVLPIAPAEEA